DRQFVEPTTPVQHALAAVWRELLGVTRVSVTDNFFDLGGHSLLAMTAAMRIERDTGIRLNVRRLIFETLEQLAHIEQDADSQPAAAKRGGWLRRLIGNQRS